MALAAELIKQVGATPVNDLLPQGSLRFDVDGMFLPGSLPKNTYFKRYNWQKHEMPYCKYLFFKFNQFPYQYEYDVLVMWEHSYSDNRNYSVWVDCTLHQRTLVVHPFTFCRMVGSKYGTDRALDALKMVMHDHINRMFDKIRD